MSLITLTEPIGPIGFAVTLGTELLLLFTPSLRQAKYDRIN